MLVITDIPTIMKAQGWRVAAECMTRWFGRTGWVMPHNVKVGDVPLDQLTSGQLEESLLTMQWALSFSRVNTAFNELITRVWNDPAGLRRLGALVRRELADRVKGGMPADANWRFGDLSQPTKIVSVKSQVNFQTVGSMTDALDDFYGAVGKGTLNVAVAGDVANPKGGKLSIAVDQLGVYLRDAYDFNGEQPLGAWTEAGIDRSSFDQIVNVYVKSYPPIATQPQAAKAGGAGDASTKYSVQNADFRRYRTETGKGGDFVNVSETKIVPLAQTQIFEFP